MPGTDREPSIALLADHAGFIDLLVGWYEREWGPYYGEQGPGDARRGWQEQSDVEFLNNERGMVYVLDLTAN